MSGNRFAKSKDNPATPSFGQVLAFSQSLAHEEQAGRSTPRQGMALSKIIANPDQPRRFFAEEALRDLAQNIREHGVLQPLMVRPKNGVYEIVFGERRYRAAKLAGLQEVPVVIRELNDDQVLILAATENLLRENLNIFEEVHSKLTLAAYAIGASVDEAPALLRRIRSSPESHPQEVAALTSLFTSLGRGKWESFVANKLGVLKLPEPLNQAVRSGQLEYSKALLIARAPEEQRSALCQEVIEEGLTQEQISERLRDGAQSKTVSEMASVKKLLNPRRLSQLNEPQKRRAEQLIQELHALLGRV